MPRLEPIICRELGKRADARCQGLCLWEKGERMLATGGEEHLLQTRVSHEGIRRELQGLTLVEEALGLRRPE